MKANVVFENVSKEYTLYKTFTTGFKGFILNLRNSLREIKNNKLKALDNISFKIFKGESVGIIGQNGAGKSTVLSLIAGTLKPSSGRVTVEGRVAPLLELGAGFHPELTGIENIILNGVLLGMRKREIIPRLESIINFSELGEFIYQPIKTYSSGMLARLGFSVAIHTDPEILLIDEILAVGDFKFQEKCINKLLEFKEKGITIVIVSHSIDDVRKLCDRVILLHKGKKIFDGKVEEGIEKYYEIFS